MNMYAHTRENEAQRLEEKKLPVMEIFGPTVQGEGAVIGQRTFFVRFGLCDYKCKMCDSMHAVDPHIVSETANWWTQQEIFDQLYPRLLKTNCCWVTFSGGNPAIHDLLHLTTLLREHSISISVETQGTFGPPWLGLCDYITVSPKGPGMGEKFEQGKFLNFVHRFAAHSGLSVKVVIFSAIDLEFASAIAEMVPQLVNSDRFYLSLGNPYPPSATDPINSDSDYLRLARNEDEPADYLAESMNRYKQLIEDLSDYPALKSARPLPQLHHWLWGNEKGR